MKPKKTNDPNITDSTVVKGWFNRVGLDEAAVREMLGEKIDPLLSKVDGLLRKPENDSEKKLKKIAADLSKKLEEKEKENARIRKQAEQIGKKQSKEIAGLKKKLEKKQNDKAEANGKFSKKYPTLEKYNKRKFKINYTELIKYCGRGSKVEIPFGVNAIGEYAFEDCRKITDVIIPEGVEIIREGAFKGCYDLMNIDIPKSVDEIEYNAFEYCWSLRRINYGGKKAYWYAIKKDNANDWYGNYHCVVYCTDGRITKKDR